MKIETIVVTPFAQNARVLSDEISGASVVVDPGGEVHRIMTVITANRLNVEAIWITHAHIDHVGGVSELLTRLRELGQHPLLYGHRIEQQMRAGVGLQAQMFGLPSAEYVACPEPDNYVDEGDTVAFGNYNAKVVFTPGHSPGHVSFFFPDVDARPLILSGDVLFAGSIGRTDLPGGDHHQLLDTLRTKFASLPLNTRVLSGHGPETNIGHEIKTNPFLR